jgi:hypothetical protein
MFHFKESIDVFLLLFKMLHINMRFTLMISSTKLVFARNLGDLIYCSTVVSASLQEALATQRIAFSIHVRRTTAVEYHSLTG